MASDCLIENLDTIIRQIKNIIEYSSLQLKSLYSLQGFGWAWWFFFRPELWVPITRFFLFFTVLPVGLNVQTTQNIFCNYKQYTSFYVIVLQFTASNFLVHPLVTDEDRVKDLVTSNIHIEFSQNVVFRECSLLSFKKFLLHSTWLSPVP